MSKQGKRGQPPKNYRTSWGETVDGLTRQPDGRWRDQRSGKRWTDADESHAVAAYKRLRGIAPVAFVESTRSADVDALARAVADPTIGRPAFVVDIPTDDDGREVDRGGLPVAVGQRLPESAVWDWLREQVAERPEFVAARLGVSLAALRDVRPSPTFAAMLAAYRSEAGRKRTSDKTVDKVAAAWGEFVGVVCSDGRPADADSIDANRVRAYRDWAESRTAWGAETRRLAYARVKAVVGASAREGIDVARPLGLLKMLTVPDGGASTNPTPMTREAFRRMLDSDPSPAMRATLLLGLNCSIYVADIVALRWSDIRPDGTIVCRRGKTNVIRAAVLWPETIDAIAALERKGRHVLTSRLGNGYGVNSIRTDYNNHRKRCGVAASKSTQFAALRDAAYTIASRVSLEEAKVLGGHKVGGLSDHYIERTPEYVADACSAIRDAFIV